MRRNHSYSFRARRREVQAEIVRRVAAGETLAGVCAEADMPSLRAVQFWRRACEGFDAEMRAALARGRSLRRYGWDEARAEAVLARVRAGASLAAALRAPGAPSPSTVRYWRATQPDFQYELWRLARERRRERARANGKAAHRPFDRFLADRIIVAAGRGATLAQALAKVPGAPEKTVVARWRREDEEFRMGLAFAMKVGARARTQARALSWADRLVAKIEAGASLHALAASGKAPSRMTLWRWMRDCEAFRTRILAACDERAMRLMDKIVTIEEDVLEEGHGLAEMRRRRKPWTTKWARLEHRPGYRQARTWSRRKKGGRAE